MFIITHRGNGCECIIYAFLFMTWVMQRYETRGVSYWLVACSKQCTVFHLQLSKNFNPHPFGSYIHIYEKLDPTNNFIPQKTGAFIIFPSKNSQEEYKFLNFTAIQKLVCQKLTNNPLCTYIIKYANTLDLYHTQKE